MASLVVLKFHTPEGAQEGLDLAVGLQKDHLLRILDAAMVTWPLGAKKPRTRQSNLSAVGALDGAFWGLLFGFLFFLPVLGAALGATVGAITGDMVNYGIGKDFIREVQGKIVEGSSGLFLLVDEATVDKVVEAFKAAPTFEIVASNLTNLQEKELKEAFA